MATASSLLSEEKFLCSVCLDVFTEPVSTPCGHSFCRACIQKCWDNSDDCKCPLCNRTFSPRPELQVNTVVSELTAEFKALVQVKASTPEPQLPGTADVLCDICSEMKEHAVKSCLTCLASFCKVHLEPHQRVAGLKSHTLLDPVKNLDDRMRDHAVDLTFDPETAYCTLVISQDGKQVTDTDTEQELPYSPKRFEQCKEVLTKEGFTTGKFYYEVQVKDNTDWIVGVVREPVNRKEDTPLSVKNGYWIIGLDDGIYSANIGVELTPKEKLDNVGIFVDYNKGVVSFYDVKSKSHIYSFTGCHFTEKLYPYFYTHMNRDGTNSAPIIITPVPQTH
ncbi:E3 ubiquitin-protein ligase TRIM39-like [Centropristis striata]|uniref:E3 ubiquitin-protein ligase TRIM39-like n=1 Tax=Centropristis striata TaxID=184440 RepID=UPI0027E19A3C|nr:E3 ubiquitin-protein ligase TRIM39-like [Centropristis striata]